MTLVHDITAALPALRAEAESMMVDACTITRGGGAASFDPDTGVYTQPSGTTIYSGACEVQVMDGLNAQESEAGGTDLTISRVTVKVPITATGVAVGDLVLITSAELDLDLVGQEFTVVAGHAKTFATCRRLQVERLTT